MYKTRIGLLAVVAVLAAAVSAVAVGDDDPGLRLVENFVSDVNTLQGEFEQALVDVYGDVVESTTGTLEIARPSQFRWTYTEPYEQWLIADGLNIWSYDLDLEQITVKPQADALANTPALLLGGSEDALDQFEYGGSRVDEETTWVRLMPLDSDSGFLRVELGFVDGQLARMAFYDHLEQTTLVELANVRTNEPIDPSRFEFMAPDGVDIVGNPALAATE